MLILLMLASTQMALMTSLGPRELELDETPVRSETLDNSGVVSIDIGSNHACVIGTLNQMKCWGSGEDGKTGHENTASYGDDAKEMGQYLMFTDVGAGLTFTDVGAGQRHTCALVNDGSVRCWGSNHLLGSYSGEDGSGARGDGYMEMGSAIPAIDRFGTDSLDPGRLATSISVGDYHACAITNDSTEDTLFCWGESGSGQLGKGNTNTEWDTSGGNGITYLPDRGVGLSQVSAGSAHTCILWDDGEMACWGSNSHGQLGIGSTEDIGDDETVSGNYELVDLPSGRTATSIAAGEDMTCAILDDASLACWGWGDSGRLGTESTADIGDGAGEMGDNLATVDLGTGLTVVSFATGYGSSCAILDDGDATTPYTTKCWGKGDDGALGYGDAVTRGDGQYEMGNYLPSVDLGTSLHATSIDVGDAFACAILNDSQVKCWGTGMDGRTGLGKSGATGDESGEMGDDLEYVELFMPEPTLDQPCDLPAEGEALSQETLDSTSSYVGNKTSTAMTPDSCGAVAYVDETNDVVRFGIFYKGKWSTEAAYRYPIDPTYRIKDVSLAIDASGVPHIVIADNAGGGSMYYATKVDGDWASYEISHQGSGSIVLGDSIAISIEVDNDGNLYIVAQEIDTGGDSIVRAFTCTASEYNSTQCLSDWDWGSGAPFDANDELAYATMSNSLDTDVALDGTIHVTYITNESDTRTIGDFSGHVMVVQLDSDGFGTPVNTSALAHVPGGAVGLEGAVRGNSSLALDLGLDGSMHIAYLGSPDGIHYLSCSSSCDSPGSWTSEDITDSVDITDTGVIDIAVGADLSVLVMAATADGTYALQKSGGTWEKTELEGTGGSDWVGVELSEQGKMWGYAYYPGTSAAMTAFTQEGVATAGLLTDIDGDGWSRLDELRCGTDYTNSSSTPADADGDGVCDLFDDWEDTSVSAESDALAIGEEFGCAVLSNRSVACWGDNSEGQLGSPSSGSSSAYAVMVDLPAGFEAGAVDAGSAHACSTGLDGKLVCWGRNTDGQLGRGNSSPSEAPGYVTLPSGVTVSQFAAGADHNCMTGTDSNMYCWGNGSDDRTGKILNSANTVTQYENFTDDSRSWTSTYPTYLLGPGQGTDYIDKVYYNWWLYPQIYSDQSFDVTPGDVISFKMRGKSHGDNGYTSEVVKFYAG
ncbi:MAG: hypothetical protein MKZ60_05165, partial [Candidatus Thalassarchaeum sp.]|nr:hypothetical protein [Candidatus Thalassarchaeum sp.]